MIYLSSMTFEILDWPPNDLFQIAREKYCTCSHTYPESVVPSSQRNNYEVLSRSQKAGNIVVLNRIGSA